MTSKTLLGLFTVAAFAAYAVAAPAGKDTKKPAAKPAANAAAAKPAAKPAAPPPSAAERANAIAFKFYGKAAAEQKGNVLFSPYSLHTAFAMAYEGAAGKTAEEMQKVFNFNPDKAAGRAAFAGLGRELEAAAAGAEFKQANAFWVLPGYRFLPEYLKALTDDYKADARQANFSGNPEAARQEINLWTAEQTRDKIKDLFPPNSLTTLTRMVLVNAVYFKGMWEKSFPKDRTADADFTPYGGAPVKARMMTFPKNADLDYTENDDVQALRLPYKGGTLAMLLVLPRDAAKFAAFEKGLDAPKLAALRAGLGREKVKVFLPRFTFSSFFSLNDALAGLGMPLAFTDAADFSGMDGSRRLYIQKAVQKAFIEVNEEGTEAAAATGVAMGLKSMDFPTAVFRADRPFLFFIEDTKSGAVLFMGRVENPVK